MGGALKMYSVENMSIVQVKKCGCMETGSTNSPNMPLTPQFVPLYSSIAIIPDPRS